MKPVVVFVLTFVVAAAASTGAKVVMTKRPPPVHGDSALADSTHADSTRADSTKAAAGPDSSRTDTAVVASGQPVTPPADTARPVAAPTVDTAKPKPAQVLASATLPVATDTVAEASERRIAKVFTSMDAKQAAKVLEHMTDNDVKVILGYVGVKQAASIMAALPPERVATLSKLAMQGRK
jgi:hypothetical protein